MNAVGVEHRIKREKIQELLQICGSDFFFCMIFSPTSVCRLEEQSSILYMPSLRFILVVQVVNVE